MATDAQEKKHEIMKSVNKSWMLRECSDYYLEYKNCSSIKGKIHSYYVTGKMPKCHDWLDNFHDCQKWINDVDKHAAERVIKREDERIKERWVGHIKNDVWSDREEPPPDWDSELPPHLKEASEKSLLKTVRLMQEKEERCEAAVAESSQYTARKYLARVDTAIPNCAIL